MELLIAFLLFFTPVNMKLTEKELLDNITNNKPDMHFKSVPVYVMKCGQINAFALDIGKIVVCQETLDFLNVPLVIDPKVQVIVAHEYYHITTRSPTLVNLCLKTGVPRVDCVTVKRSAEWIADTLAFDWAKSMGYDQTVCEFWKKMATIEVKEKIKDDTHPPMTLRYDNCKSTLPPIRDLSGSIQI